MRCGGCGESTVLPLGVCGASRLASVRPSSGVAG